MRAIGASNYSAARLDEALQTSARLKLPRYESLQPLYNLVERAAYEGELEALCRREGLGVINYFGLASGFLTGKYRSEADADKSPRGGNIVKKYLNERGRRVLDALDSAAAQYKATPAQVALAWQIGAPRIDGANRQRHVARAVAGARRCGATCRSMPRPSPPSTPQAAEAAGIPNIG